MSILKYRHRFQINYFRFHFCYTQIILFSTFCSQVFCQDTILMRVGRDSVSDRQTYNHQIGLEFRPAYLIPTHPFFRGVNSQQSSITQVYATHLKYSFGLPAGTVGDAIFPDAQQGIGVALYEFGNKEELGRPVVAYLFQHAPIARLHSRLSLHYEWNAGLSTGWKPYDKENNPNNKVVGSVINAFVSAGLSLRWKLTGRWIATGGMDVTHFSNGNTKYPNAGVNAAGFKLGMLYDFSHAEARKHQAGKTIPMFSRHISYDFVMFGSWRSKAVEFLGKMVPSPYKYPVLGAYVAPMYNFGYRFRTGLSLDALYDGSANVYTQDYIEGTEQPFFNPTRDRQMAMGMSLRAEYVMPFFTVGLGLGSNLVHKGGDLQGTYQSLYLKINSGRNFFLHAGYCLKDFYDPNFLMLGFGYSFNNRSLSLFSR